MPTTPHIERHFTATETVRDIVIGMSDGLTIHNEPSGETIISGLFIDQAALFGTLNKVHSLNLILISVNRFSAS